MSDPTWGVDSDLADPMFELELGTLTRVVARPGAEVIEAGPLGIPCPAEGVLLGPVFVGRKANAGMVGLP